ncbi:ribonuclease Z [Algimonas arctica]|uniref:Ribonuclease Z n=1 Tax=Algimonas arctica TaxID=1479486 RepID=A0A8J3CSM9_9PROT|nr:MBL fold metallo-hydrolase [Algimonas arctica]GHA95546.1 ribonuclease Z [Algimonas arctica]
MKKIIAIGVILLLAGLAALRFAHTVLVPNRFEALAQELVGTNTTADFDDGLYVFIGGAGAPIPDPLRNGPTLGILAGDKAFIIDAGSGGFRNLLQMGFPVDKIDNIYLTHLHSDHIDGLGEALMLSWINGRRDTPLPVTGPRGTEIVTDGFMQAYRLDSQHRTEHHGVAVANPSGFGAQPIEIDGLDSQVLRDEGGLKITAFTVDHAPVKGAFGYRIDYKDRSIAISGDTVYSPNLIAQSQGVDVLFHEALNTDMVATLGAAAEKNGAVSLAKIMADIPDYHTSPHDAARAATEVDANALVLYHIIPPLPAKALNKMFLGDAVDVYDGPITVSRDGTVISLPSGSDAVSYDNRL